MAAGWVGKVVGWVAKVRGWWGMVEKLGPGGAGTGLSRAVCGWLKTADRLEHIRVESHNLWLTSLGDHGGARQMSQVWLPRPGCKGRGKALEG